MAELTCDDYMLKLNEIISTCNNATTTKIQLETLLGELETLDNQVDTDIETMSLPSTMEHLNKYILTQYMRLSKIDLQRSLYKLIDVRNSDLLYQAVHETTTKEEQHTYALETIEIKNLVETVINSCSCMSGRKYVVNRCAH